MLALVDVAIAMLVATGSATLIVKLPLAAQSWFRQFARVLFSVILTVNTLFVGNTREAFGLKSRHNPRNVSLSVVHRICSIAIRVCLHHAQLVALAPFAR